MLKTYDPKLVILTVGGAVINGFADGTFVSAERSNDMFTKVVGADGITSRAKSNDKSGTITITLAQTSSGNDILSGYAARDELANAGVVTVSCKDLSGRSTFFSATGWIRKVPNSEFGKEVGDREWAIDCADLELFVGGHAPAIPV